MIPAPRLWGQPLPPRPAWEGAFLKTAFPKSEMSSTLAGTCGVGGEGTGLAETAS